MEICFQILRGSVFLSVRYIPCYNLELLIDICLIYQFD